MASIRPAPDGNEVRPLKALNLFGYLSLAGTACASRAGRAPALAWPREVCHDGAARIPTTIQMTPDMDEFERWFDKGVTDGLPVIPPTRERVDRMLAGTTRPREDLVGEVPPNYGRAIVEKIATNA